MGETQSKNWRDNFISKNIPEHITELLESSPESLDFTNVLWPNHLDKEHKEILESLENTNIKELSIVVPICFTGNFHDLISIIKLPQSLEKLHVTRIRVRIYQPSARNVDRNLCSLLDQVESLPNMQYFYLDVYSMFDHKHYSILRQFEIKINELRKKMNVEVRNSEY